MQTDRIFGLPKRMGVALAATFANTPFEKRAFQSEVVQRVQREKSNAMQGIGPVPVDAQEAEIYQCADSMVREVYKYADRYKDNTLILDAVGMLCRLMGVPMPLGESDAERVRRAVDKQWWLRSIRKEHARRFENVARSLGFVSYKAGVYISNESAVRQIKRNEQNAKLLAATELVNECGHKYTLEQLSELGVSNKAIRRGELMTRIRGFEEIAKEVGDSGMFWTITAPSKYHAVLSKSGDMNPAFHGQTVREAQAYLCKVWARIRASMKRAGIQPYGFRIAEPHHDGCPHWHMLLFVDKARVNDMEMIVFAHALREDEEEKGAKENRVKLVNIEAGKGTAAGYIAKYVAKNIDGAHVGDHKTANPENHQDGWIVTDDMFSGKEIAPSQRVTLWAQAHGIRQFQQIGGAPIGVWREMRRVKVEQIINASPDIKAAWASVQKTGDSQADWAAFCRAAGGVTVGRASQIQIAKKEAEIKGKYGDKIVMRPCGVYSVKNVKAVYESTRYQWSRVDGAGGGVAVDLPWTGVNNCTRTAESNEFKEWKKDLIRSREANKNLLIVPDALAHVMKQTHRQPEDQIKTVFVKTFQKKMEGRYGGTWMEDYQKTIYTIYRGE